jgi:hypothetical protein
VNQIDLFRAAITAVLHVCQSAHSGGYLRLGMPRSQADVATVRDDSGAVMGSAGGPQHPAGCAEYAAHRARTGFPDPLAERRGVGGERAVPLLTGRLAVLAVKTELAVGAGLLAG